jgi:energy-coupling factor transporter ATP-binding protein EcfA2
MKVGNITESQDIFSYKNAWFSNQKFIISTRDERNENYIIPIVLFDNGALVDLDDYEFENYLWATKPPYNNPKNIENLPINRFYKNEIIRINNGNIIPNSTAEDPSSPKIKTFNANINALEPKQVVEFFEGDINENESQFKPNQLAFFELIKNVYVESENCFFVINNNKLIGPFKALKVNEDSFKITKSSWRPFGEYNLNEDSFIEFLANDIKRKIFIPDCKNLKLIFKNEYGFISDEELLKQFEMDLKNHPDYFNESSLENIKKIIHKSSDLKSLEKIIKDNIRLKNLLEKSEKILIQNIDLINSFPKVKEIKEGKEKIEEELFVAQRELDEINNKKKELEVEISNLEQTKTEELENRKIDLDNAIISLENRKNNLTKEVEQEKLNLENTLEQVKKDIDRQRIIQDDLKAGVQKLKSEFTSEQKNAQEKLAELVKGKTHFDFISGRDLSEQETETFNYTDFKIIDQYNQSQYRDFRNELVNILRQHNRNFDTHYIDNLLISIFQNTLTIFAGVPGTGKTTLARLLTNILAPKEKIREISVNRGWSSQKDFIGFVNPLTKKFHSSSTDIYSLIKQMNHEAKDKEIYLNSPMSFVILDEANLSPLEHYWSSFYNLTDSSGMLEIKLGHNEAVKFPNNLRFIGTINYDHTTEELSPRVLDRINIIQLNKTEDLNFSGFTNLKIKNIQLSFQRCIDFFELIDFNPIELKIEDKIEKGYKEIKNEFKNLKIFISPRVEIAIKRYITLASKYMSDVNKPLDYCVAQRLLPLINLQGSENKQKLEFLKERLKDNKCEIAIRILEEIISIGSEKGIYEDSFNYFLTLSNV